MPRVLLTAFEPYDDWKENSSWLTLVELTRWFDMGPDLVTRRYPVDFQAVKHRLAIDMQEDYDLILHLGQSPGSSVMQLEGFGVNMGSNDCPLIEDGNAAYRTDLPLLRWSEKLAERGIPAHVSYHAGTFLCNATPLHEPVLLRARTAPHGFDLYPSSSGASTGRPPQEAVAIDERPADVGSHRHDPGRVSRLALALRFRQADASHGAEYDVVENLNTERRSTFF